MRKKLEIIKDAKKIIREHECITSRLDTVRTRLKRSYDMYWLLVELVKHEETE